MPEMQVRPLPAPLNFSLKKKQMTSFQIALDRYLTSEPEDDFTPFCEALEDKLREHIWQKLEDERGRAWSQNKPAKIDDIEWLLYRKDGMTPKRAAAIVNRIYRNK